MDPLEHNPHWRVRDNRLFCDEVALDDLADAHGTPVYVYSRPRILENARRLREAFDRHYPRFRLYFAVKANNNPALLRTLFDAGVGADCSCLDEIRLAEMAGAAPADILYSGVYNADAELREALRGHRRLNVEDASHVTRIARLVTEEGLPVPELLSLRINPGVGMGGFDLVFAGPDAKFGVPAREIEGAYARARDMGVKRFGMHMMTGSAILDEAYFEQITQIMMDIAGQVAQRLGIRFDFIDVGGGLGIPYEPDQEPLDAGDLAERVVRAFRQKLDQYDLGEPELVMEPGRYLVGDAALLLAEVISIKEGEHKTFVGVDAGMQTLLRPALYNAYHHIVNASSVTPEETRMVNVVGQVCENTDQLARDRRLGTDIALGHRLAILDAGAYGFGMSSNYNTRMRAAEVMVDGKEHRLIRRHETFEDFIATAVWK